MQDKASISSWHPHHCTRYTQESLLPIVRKENISQLTTIRLKEVFKQFNMVKKLVGCLKKQITE